jgi:undecaprenyl-diphosphatase
MDWSLTHALNAFLAGHDAVEDPLVAYVGAAEVLFAGVLLAVFALARGRSAVGVRRLVAAAGASAALALLLALVVSHAVGRPRPFVAHPGALHLFAAHAADPGFPSDHATAAFAIAVAVLLRDRRWGLPVLVAAVVLAAGRVAMGVHYPSDVAAGAVLGTLSALALWTAGLRRAVHAVADTAGRALDALAGAVAGAVRPRSARS